MNRCLACGYRIDSASDPVGDTEPEAGDISICLQCGHLMAFTDSLTVRPLTRDEMITVAGDAEILAIQKARAELY